MPNAIKPSCVIVPLATFLISSCVGLSNLDSLRSLLAILVNSDRNTDANCRGFSNFCDSSVAFLNAFSNVSVWYPFDRTARAWLSNALAVAASPDVVCAGVNVPMNSSMVSSSALTIARSSDVPRFPPASLYGRSRTDRLNFSSISNDMGLSAFLANKSNASLTTLSVSGSYFSDCAFVRAAFAKSVMVVGAILTFAASICL